MKIFRKLSNHLHYFYDILCAEKLKIAIESFSFDSVDNTILVFYRIGRQKLLNKMDIAQFEREYFDKISAYDQHRLTRFSIFQQLLIKLFHDKYCNIATFINYIENEAIDERLF